ncbi:photosynthetic complex assembly protein PuhC [Pseudohaliea rubra]|uniref:photosynthetic complex assembly protein PuhC n=1 Tax=Pseudohaliea rubra TaxID=475795 RepID=UPI000690BFC6|nr:photosynthetic complex assembly protein PuhC [Pseudohaliea rubra]
MAAQPPWPLSRWIASAVGAVVVFTVIGVASLRLSGYEPPAEPRGAMVDSRLLRFEDVRNGLVYVYDAQSGDRLAQLAPAEDSFIRGIMRSMARARRARDIGMQPAFLLARYADGSLVLADTALENEVNLVAFGQTNEASFAALLTAEPR